MAPLGVQREQPDAQLARSPGGPLDRVGDVVQLEVQEDPAARRHEVANKSGALGDEELQTDLHDAEVVAEALHEIHGGSPVPHVEREGQVVPRRRS